MTFGSLFAGIGGMDLGLERAGMTCKWQVEIDPYARRVLEKHWPDVRRWDDVRTFPPQGDWGVDLICGGFPCQDISKAGHKAGINGNRSGLWSEYARIIGSLQPRYVFLENVADLLVRGINRVLGDLAEIGYDAEWDVIPASAFGAPHQRERLFLIAYPGGIPRRCCLENHKYNGIPQNIQWSATQGIQSGGGWQRWLESTVSVMDREGCVGSIRRMDDGDTNEVDRLRCLGNAVVPQVAEFVGRMIMESEAAL
jgi:DNA (cytosine-5)-methyltransferase 1